jgi:hypothetical protein
MSPAKKKAAKKKSTTKEPEFTLLERLQTLQQLVAHREKDTREALGGLLTVTNSMLIASGLPVVKADSWGTAADQDEDDSVLVGVVEGLDRDLPLLLDSTLADMAALRDALGRLSNHVFGGEY